MPWSFRAGSLAAGWSCDLCDFVIPLEEKHPAKVRLQHLRAHGAPAPRLANSLGEVRKAGFQSMERKACERHDAWRAQRPACAHDLVHAGRSSVIEKGYATGASLGRCQSCDRKGVLHRMRLLPCSASSCNLSSERQSALLRAAWAAAKADVADRWKLLRRKRLAALARSRPVRTAGKEFSSDPLGDGP